MIPFISPWQKPDDERRQRPLATCSLATQPFLVCNVTVLHRLNHMNKDWNQSWIWKISTFQVLGVFCRFDVDQWYIASLPSLDLSLEAKQDRIKQAMCKRSIYNHMHIFFRGSKLYWVNWGLPSRKHKSGLVRTRNCKRTAKCLQSI